MNNGRTAGIAVLVAAVAGVGGFLLFRSSQPPAAPGLNFASSATASHEIGSSVSPERQSAVVPAARTIPDVLPDFELATLAGPPRRLSAFQHPLLVVNFWATWCAPCRREIPLLNTIRQQRAADGVEIVGIAVDFRDDVLKYAERIRIDYPLLMGEEDGLRAANAFGMDLLLPFTVFADAQRRIVTVKVGELHADEADFILDQIADLNGGRRDLAAVRSEIAARLAELAAARAKAAAPSGAAAKPATS